MRLLDFLRCWGSNNDFIKVEIWVAEDDEGPIFEGQLGDIPWTIAEMKLAFPQEDDNWDSVVTWVDGWGKKDDRPGFSIIVKD